MSVTAIIMGDSGFNGREVERGTGLDPTGEESETLNADNSCYLDI